jgi:hypothetical protein
MPVNLGHWPRPGKNSKTFDRLWDEDVSRKFENAFSITDRVAKAIYDKMVSMNTDECNYVGEYEGRRNLTQLEGDFDLRAIAEAAIAEARE